MGQIINGFRCCSSSTRSSMPSPQFRFSRDCSRFLNWKYHRKESQRKKAIVFRSLVATVKLQPALDVSLEDKAVDFLEFVSSTFPNSLDLFLDSFASNSDESLTNFVQSIVVLISSPNLVITTAAIRMLWSLLVECSTQHTLALVQADLIPQIISTLNPQSLSFKEAEDLHIFLLSLIGWYIKLATPFDLDEIETEDDDEQPAVYEAVFQQVLVPSEKYLCHLCMNRFSIIDGDQSSEFMELLARLLGICTHCELSMNLVRDMPVMLTIPSYLTFFEDDSSISYFLEIMNYSQEEWNNTRGEDRPRWKELHRMLRMEGIEDVIEEKLRNDEDENGSYVVAASIEWNNVHGMNIAEQN
ncbi:hypothetical protein BLNAU_17266 [Blattamonas nauphoetae]|uniref:Uncharacterized protein n=1 Tax=Blattamonas nauphoetae TaxID=2049346 RepID=A0ABQ9XC41_9EUKA|nr:hypothetical protein BLNAU_17266 [Blattamonas nauphoetae]